MTPLFKELSDILKEQIPPLRIRKESDESMEVCGTKERMQGKQKVDGYYFASLVQKPKDVRLYFFPIYTHVDHFSLTADLKKFLKGKSCFHVKNLDPELKKEIQEMVKKGIELYLEDDLI
ncbi:hypothetical protein GYB22_06900 [bacterium]|nr:hypothetical protein [bacterium]